MEVKCEMIGLFACIWLVGRGPRDATGFVPVTIEMLQEVQRVIFMVCFCVMCLLPLFIIIKYVYMSL